MKVIDYLDSLIAEHPTFKMVDKSGVHSAHSIRENALRLIPSLQDIGLRSGDVVILSLPNRIEFFEILLACFYSGTIPMLVNPKMPISELSRLKNRSNAKTIVSSYDQLRYSIGGGHVKFPSNRTIDEPGLYMLTSGTTGQSKIIVHSISSFFGSATSFGRLVGYSKESRVFHNWPMIYMAGIFNLFAVPLVTGSTVIVSEPFGPQTMTSYWNDLDENEVTDVLLTPTMSASLSRIRRYSERSSFGAGLKSLVSTSSPLYPTIFRRFFEEFGLELSSCYGITEFGGSLTLARPPFDVDNYSVGDWIEEAQVQISNESGEVFIKTPHMALCYLMPDGSTQELGPQEFHPTGDIGMVKQNVLSLTGRLKDTIKRGGVPISMTDVENTVLASGIVVDVVGQPRIDEYWGEVYDLRAVPIDSKSARLVEADLWRFINTHLPEGAGPEKVFIVNEIEKTVSGKSVRYSVAPPGRD
jgi:acyl-coenzyme A synthetase/AMP-(fatty) acid ligase